MKVVCVRGGFRFTSGKIYDAVNFSSMVKSGTPSLSSFSMPVCLFNDEGQMRWYDLERIDFLITLEKWRENQLDNLEI
jgi:hypothetical protein